MQAHPDILARAAAALTVEHLGCTEWIDTVGGGYHATGQPEIFFVWTTQGKMFELTRDAVLKHRPERTALMRPPAQFGVGSPYQTAGIPQIGAIAGPDYMLDDLPERRPRQARRAPRRQADRMHRGPRNKYRPGPRRTAPPG